MTGILASAACCRTLFIDLLSMGGMVSALTTLAPSEIQRSEDLVDIAIPIVAPLVLPPFSSLPPSLLWPQAERVRAREAAPAMEASAVLRLRMIIILDVGRCQAWRGRRLVYMI